MSNKNLNIQQWATVGSVSTPDSGYRKIYPKSGEYFWYTVSEDGTEKQMGLSIYPKNGLSSTTLGSGNQFGAQLDIVLGSGLTFSADAPGSAILVRGLTSISLSSTGGATAGYLLSVLSNGTFNWIPNNPAGISGTTNSIPKFSTTTSIGDSQIKDNGSNVFIGTLPTFVPSLFNVNGSASFLGNVYLTDDSNNYIKWDNGYYFYSNTYDFSVNGKDINYIRGSQDGVNSFSFSVLNDSFYVELNGATSGSARFKGYNLQDIYFGKIGQESTIDVKGQIFLANPNGIGITITATYGSGFLLADGNEGIDKILTSFDSSGNSTWKYIGSGLGISASGLTISVSNGNGLTFSGNSLIVSNGNGLTFSGNNLVVNTGNGLTFSSGRLITQNGNGLTFSGNNLTINNGNGLTFSNGSLVVAIGKGLTFSSGNLDTKIFYTSTTAPSGYTGTSSETILMSVRLDSNTVRQNDVVEVEFRIFKGGTSSSWTPSLRIGSAPSILGSVGIITPTTLLSANDYQTITMQRNLYVLSSTNSTEFYPNLSNFGEAYADYNKPASKGPSYSAIDWSQTQYFQLCSTMGTSSTADTITASYLRVKVWKS